MIGAAAAATVLTGTPPPVHPWPIGRGPGYLPQARTHRVAAGLPVGRFRCGDAGQRDAVHVELFARRRVIVVPSGIGVAPSGCSYALRTRTPTGVVEVRRGRSATLGDLFRIWGQPLTRTRLGLFRSRRPVRLYVDGRRRRGDPRTLPLRRHAQIVLELGGYVAPHPGFRFPPGS